MNFAAFMRTADSLSLTITVVYFSVYVGHFWVKNRVKDIQKVREKALYGLVESKGEELINFIKRVDQNEPLLLLPPRPTNIYLHISTILYAFASFASIFYDGIAKFWPNVFFLVDGCETTEKEWNLYINTCFSYDASTSYSIFFALLFISCGWLFVEYKYWHAFNRLKDEHFSNDHTVTITKV